jgi:hypothetical protein
LPVDRTLSLYFLNTAEHLALSLSPSTNLELLVAATRPYLAAEAAIHLLPFFEAAHSVVLAVLCAPQNSTTATTLAPYYANILFGAFPGSLSPRQFRLAFKTLLRAMLPPSPLAASDPNLSSILLELLHYRTEHASQTLIPVPDIPANKATSPPASERSVLTLTILDSLPFLPRRVLNEWLPLADDLVQRISPGPMQEECRARLWQIIADGEMDPDKALVTVSWWSGSGTGQQSTNVQETH